MPSRETSKSFGYTPAAVEIVALCNNANPSSPTDPEEIEELEYRREMDQFLEKELIRLRVAMNKIRRAEMIECGFPAPQLTGESDEDYLNIDFNNNNGN